jgi:hypothetical protein
LPVEIDFNLGVIPSCRIFVFYCSASLGNKAIVPDGS